MNPAFLRFFLRLVGQSAASYRDCVWQRLPFPGWGKELLKRCYKGIDDFIITVIEKEVAKLKGRYGIGIDDLEDLEQDLHAQVWKKITGEIGPHHPNYRASVRKTIDSRIKDIIEYRTAERRKDGIKSISIDQPVKKKKTAESEELPLFEILDLELFCEFFGDSVPAWYRHRHRKFDVESALNQLPSELRRLADTIDTLNGNMSAVARELRVTRKKLRCDLGKLQQRLRELLED